LGTLPLLALKSELTLIEDLEERMTHLKKVFPQEAWILDDM
jgi:hypothetical protein